MFDSPISSVKSLLSVSELGSRSDVTSSPTQIPLCAVVNIEIACSNACRNARILSIEIIFSLKGKGKLVDFFRRKKLGGLVLNLYMGFRATLNCRKFKVTLNPMYRFCLNFVKSCVLSCLSKVDNIKKIHRAVFEL